MWRLENNGYFLAKPRTFAKKYGFAKLYRVLPKGIGVSPKGLRNLSMIMIIAVVQGIDIVINNMEPYEKV